MDTATTLTKEPVTEFSIRVLLHGAGYSEKTVIAQAPSVVDKNNPVLVVYKGDNHTQIISQMKRLLEDQGYDLATRTELGKGKEYLAVYYRYTNASWLTEVLG